MSAIDPTPSAHEIDWATWIDDRADQFEAAWRDGRNPQLEDFLADAPDALRARLASELVLLDLEHRILEKPHLDSYLQRFPELGQLPVPEFSEFRRAACHLAGRASGMSQMGMADRAKSGELNWDQPGGLFLGRFQLIGRTGSGGFGVVYKARDIQLDRIVAIKVPHPDRIGSDEQLAKFMREARIAAMLKHPGIVQIHDIVLDDAIPYIVCEFVEGLPLDRYANESNVSYRHAAELVCQVARALDFGHRLNIVHRDIKPGNIMIAPDGHPVILDFGLARCAADPITVDRGIQGTPVYMAPEQLSGSGHSGRPTSDVYGLGIVLYELITGQLPFRGNTARVIHQIVNDEPAEPQHFRDDIPLDLQTICLKAISKTAAQRYPSAGHLAADLQRFLEGKPITARRSTGLEKLWRCCRRNPHVSALTALSVLSLLLLAAGGLISSLIMSRLVHVERTAQVETRTQASRQLASSGVAQLQRGSALGLFELIRATEMIKDQTAEYRSRLRVAGGWLESIEGRLLGVAGHEQPITNMQFSPDGRVFATASVDGSVRVWKSETTTPLTPPLKLPDTQRTIIKLWFVGEGNGLLALDYTGRAGLWEWKTETLINQFTAPQPGMGFQYVGGHVRNDIAVLVYSSGERGRTEVTGWNVTTGDVVIGPLTMEHESVIASFDCSGHRMAVASREGDITLVELDRGVTSSAASVHTGLVSCLEFSPDGGWLASGAWDDTVRIWSTDDLQPLEPPMSHGEDVKDICFTPDSRKIVSAGFDGVIRIWDVRQHVQVGTDMLHSGPVLSLAVSDDGKWIASGGFDKTVRFWSSATGKPIDMPFPIDELVTDITFQPGTCSALIATRGNHVWRVQPKPDAQAERVLSHDDRVWSVDFSTDGTQLVTASQDGAAWIWEVGSERRVGPFLHRPELVCARLSPRGDQLLTANLRTYHLWDVDHPDAPRLLGESSDYCRDIRFLSDGSGAVIGTDTNRIAVLQFSPDAAVAAQWIELESVVQDVAVHPNGTQFAVSTQDGKLQIWSIDGLRRICAWQGHNGWVEAIVYRPDGQLLATAGRDLAIRFWQTDDWTQWGPTIRQTAYVQSLAFSSDGELLAAARADGKVFLYDVLSGLACGQPIEHQSFATSVEFQPGGSLLATASFDRTARLWQLPDLDLSLKQLSRRASVALGFELDPSGQITRVPWESWQQSRPGE